MSIDPQSHRRSAEEILAEEFLQARSRILDLAAFLDRLERAPGSAEEAAQMMLLTQGLEILCDDEVGKARRVQLLMSRDYDPAWQKKYGLH
ncbi:MAG: hypothetical protein ACK553_12575 [Planctomycetota bacterium]|jgi:hypothetical protein